MKVLVIRFSSIGDIVLTSPVVRCLKLQAKAEVHYLTKEAYGTLLSHNPYIDQVHLLKDSLADLWEILLEEDFDFVVDLHKNLRSWNVIGRIRKPYGTFSKANLAKWLMVNLKHDILPDKHIVHRYFEAVRELRVSYDGAGLDFYLDPQTVRPLASLHEYSVVAIGGAHNTKKLPPSKLKELCNLIRSPLVLVGGPEDKEAGAMIAADLPHITDMTGQVSIAGSAALIRDARLVITHDTGMMHIAAALKRPIISVWGNTIPDFGMYPFYPDNTFVTSAIFEVGDLSCRPCSKIGYQICPKKHFKCMNDQDLEAITMKANEILSEN